MRSLKKRFKKKLFKCLSGKRKFQYLFEKLHELSLAGMNFGGGENVQNSGERNVIDYLARHSGKDAKAVPVIFDVGSNIGVYALELIAVFKNNASIYCFEPLKEAFAALTENVGDRSNVKIYNFGLGEKEETVRIYSDRNDSPLASIFQRRMEHLGVDASYREDVKIRTLDVFCGENGISHIDLIKIDVEGNELSVLKGAKSLIDSDSVDLIQFEFGGFNVASRTFFQDFFHFLSPRFKIYRILKDGFAPVGSYKEAHEIFLTTNYLAVSKKMDDLF